MAAQVKWSTDQSHKSKNIFVNVFAFFASLDLEQRLVTKEGEP